MLYGGAGGASATGSQYWSQNTAGIADAVETGDGFGSVLTAGDFNGDGRDDLAIGVPSEDIGAVVDGGAVHVIYGSASGLAAAGSQYWSQNTASIADATEADDGFGSALTTGKLDSDAFAELLVGVPAESIGAVAGAGVVHVIRGASGAGLTATGSQLWSQNSAGIADSAEPGDAFGASLAAGDLDSGVGQDLAIGVPDEDVGAIVDGGVGACDLRLGHRPGVDGLAALDAELGRRSPTRSRPMTASAARWRSAGSTPTRSPSCRRRAGRVASGRSPAPACVHVIPGAAAGLTGTGSQLWSQNSAGIADSAEAGDGFGASLADR